MAERRTRLVPVLIFGLLALLSLLLWQMQVSHRRQILRSYTDTVADQAAIRLYDYVQTRLASLEVLTGSMVQGLAARDAGRQGVDFAFLARSFYHAQPGFQAINWLDSTGVFRVVVPPERNPRVLDFDIRQHPEVSVRDAFARAERDTAVTRTDCITLLQGGEGFGTYWPVIVRGLRRGYVNGVFRVTDSIRAALAQGVLDDFHLTVKEGSRVIFDEGEFADPGDSSRAVERRVDIPHGGPWTLILMPHRELVSRYSPARLHLFLVSNLAVSLLLSCLAAAIMRRSRAIQDARDEALRELALRQRAESEKERMIQDLERANRRLEQANQELDAYIYAASHDVRAPLVAVGGLVDILLDEEATPDPEERQHVMARIRHNIQKLDTLVQDMLAVSRSRRLERTSAPVDIRQLCEEVWSGLKDLGSDQPLDFTCEVAPDRPFPTDPRRFRQIMNNLLSNALKYRDPAKPRLEVRVTARIGEEPGGRPHLELTVRDNGVGVPEKSIPRVFDMFYKASHDAFGSGLGLYIVRQHVAALGGEVSCRSVPGGTEFRVALPGDPAV